MNRKKSPWKNTKKLLHGNYGKGLDQRAEHLPDMAEMALKDMQAQGMLLMKKTAAEVIKYFHETETYRTADCQRCYDEIHAHDR